MNRVLWAVAFLVLLGIGGVFYQGYSVPAQSQPAPRPPAAVPVVVAAVSRQPVPVRIDTIGTVQTIANVQIKSRIDGYIDQVLIHDGQFVKAGEVMFRLDSRAAEAQVHQAEATLLRDQAQLANAKRDVDRYAPLVAKDFVSRQQYDTAVTTAKALEAAVAADQAAIENNKALLSYDTIAAPMDGRVGTIAIKAGNSVKANDVPLASINQIAPIYVAFSLPQSELPAIREAMSRGPVAVEVQAQGDTGKPSEGRVAFFDNAIDISSGTIGVRAVFQNQDQRLWPGQFVKVAVTTRVDPDALVVPQAAVQISQDGNFVFVIKPDNTAEVRAVTVARTLQGQTVIAKGLKEGERVVTDGQMRLENGSRVAIRAGAAPPKADSNS